MTQGFILGSGGHLEPGYRLAKGHSSSNGSGMVTQSPSFSPSLFNHSTISWSPGDLIGISVKLPHVSFRVKCARRTKMHTGLPRLSVVIWNIIPCSEWNDEDAGQYTNFGPRNLYHILFLERKCLDVFTLMKDSYNIGTNGWVSIVRVKALSLPPLIGSRSRDNPTSDF